MVLVTEWQTFEKLVARIYQVLDGSSYKVEHDVRLTEPNGGTAQIDVMLTPKNKMTGPVLVSCKFWEDRVGVDHVREWSDIVQQQGAAAGIIVARSGFTKGAMDAARIPARRVHLWIPRELTLDDFGPDEDSPTGYIARLGLTTELAVSQPDGHTVKLKLEPADGNMNPISYVLGEEDRDSWYLRDSKDKIVGNLWDRYKKAATTTTPGPVQIKPERATYLVLEGRRFQFLGLSFEQQVDVITDRLDIDLTKLKFAYQNVLTGQVRQVPLPPELLKAQLLKVAK